MSWTDRAAGCAAVLACVTLAGCASAPPDRFAAAPPPTELDRFPIQVTRNPAQVALSVHAAGLSPTQRAALADLVGRWRAAGADEVITVQVPTNSVEEGDPRSAADAAMAAIAALGVSPARLRLAGYDAAGQPHAPVVARFDLYVATGPNCQGGWTDLSSTGDNQPHAHFGCAGAANLAAEIANARDLVAPQATPGDIVRRETALAKYRQGQITSTAKDPQAEGVVSSAVN